MLVVTKKHHICSSLLIIKMNFLSVFTHARDRCFVTSEYYRLMDVAVKTTHTTSQLILLESLFSDV